MSIFQFLFYFFIIIPSSAVHEVAHGLVALWLGDDTAKRAGRLTLNPLAHIDTFGTILMPLMFMFLSHGSFLFAYAKPVPYNPYNLKSRQDELKVAFAGPIANLLLAAVFAVITRSLYFFQLPFLSTMSAWLAVVVVANVGLAVFNLIPIPPLDGSKLLYLLIPKDNLAIRSFLEHYSLFILLVFVFFGSYLLVPVIAFLSRLFLGPLFVL